jgi:hypothetical protein
LPNANRASHDFSDNERTDGWIRWVWCLQALREDGEAALGGIVGCDWCVPRAVTGAGQANQVSTAVSLRQEPGSTCSSSPPKNMYRLVAPRASLASSDNLSLLKVRLFRLANHTRGGREASRRGWIGPGKRHYRSRCRALRAINARQELFTKVPAGNVLYFFLLPQSSTNASVSAEVDKAFWT